MTAKATIGIRYFADRDNNTENRYITSTLATFALVSIILCTCRLSIFAIRAHVQCGFPTKAMISQVDLHFAFHDLHKVRGKQNHSAVGVFWGGWGGGALPCCFVYLHLFVWTVVECNISDEIEVATIALIAILRKKGSVLSIN